MDSASVPIYKIKGVWTWLNELGGEINYDFTTGFQVSDLDTAVEYLESQGITNDIVVMCTGGGLNRSIENSGVSFVQGTSGGLNVNFTDIEGMGYTTSGDPAMTLNIGFKAIKKSGVLFLLYTLPDLTNPWMMGVDTTKLTDAGMMIPITTVKDAKSGLTIPNLSARYVGIGGYSRKRVVGTLAGMDGFAQQRFGYPLISQVDGFNTYWLSHVMFPFMEANKGLIVRRSS